MLGLEPRTLCAIGEHSVTKFCPNTLRILRLQGFCFVLLSVKVYLIFYVYGYCLHAYICASHACLVLWEPGPQLQTAVSFLEVLGIEPGFSGRAASALKYGPFL